MSEVWVSRETDAAFRKLIDTAKQSGFLDGIIFAQRAAIRACGDDKITAARVVREIAAEKPPEYSTPSPSKPQGPT